MKKIVVAMMCLCLLPDPSLFAGPGGKTIDNLKAAFAGESTASAKYAAYAAQARKENLAGIAVLFEATSKAEAIHAENHKTVLQKLGQKADPVKPEFKVNLTLENLKDALEGETREVVTMYPGYIATAKAEDVKNAAKSFTWAMDTEKKHKAFLEGYRDGIYREALERIEGQVGRGRLLDVGCGCGFFLSQARVENDTLMSVTKVLNKADAVLQLKQRFDRVVVVGEGMNDLPMFEVADVRVAFGGVHRPSEAVAKLADYVAMEGGSLCRLLNTLL